jgi:hypothetical protein
MPEDAWGLASVLKSEPASALMLVSALAYDWDSELAVTSADSLALALAA